MVTKYTKRIWYSGRLEKWCWSIEYSTDAGRSCLEHGRDMTREQADENATEAMLDWERIDSGKRDKETK